jgi:hypothetical protein
MIFFFKLIINCLFFSAKAKSFADKTADIYDEPNNATIDKKYVRLNPELVDDAARTIEREESKLHGVGVATGGAGIINIIIILDFYHRSLLLIIKFAARVRREENFQ